MLIVLASLLIASFVAVPLTAALGRKAFPLLAAVPGAGAAWVATQWGTIPRSDIDWIASLHITLSFRMDPLSSLLALIALGVGALVLLYCTFYFDDDEPRLHLFAGQLTAFAFSMFGLVTADNMLLMYIFWEFTSVLSFLLVGHYAERATSRRAATQALLVTTMGGLAMFVGIIIIGEQANTYLFSQIVDTPPTGTTISVALLLVLLGAISKSAIAPFHFWLPGAMAAPTPVSAYLHSAAMVKAGIFLVARLGPAVAESPVWQLPLLGLGTLTLLMAGWRSLREYDLKLILAFGTVSQLGFMMILVGIGSRDTMLAGLTMLLAHSLFKSALFMSVGIIDHTTGTRDVRELSGLGRRFPVLATIFGLAAASMAGLPPLLGFVGKEASLTTVLHDPRLHGMPGPVLTGVLVLGSILTFAYTFRLVFGAFRSKERFDNAASPAVTNAHPIGIGFLFVPALLAAAGLLFGVWTAPVDHAIADYVDTAFPPGSAFSSPEPYHLALWHGFELPVLFTVVVYLCGLLLYFAQRTVERMQFSQPALGNADRIYDGVLSLADQASLRLTAFIQRGSLSLNLGIIMLTLVAFPMISLLIGTREGLRVQLAAAPVVYALMLPITVAVLAAIAFKNRLSAVLAVSVTGYGVGIVFAFHGAPDLALTQVLVETLVMVVFVLVLRTLPANMPRISGLVRTRAWIAGSVGVMVMVMGAYAANARSDESIAVHFPYLASALGNGANAVNVTLVDIRAWDTLGEITVLIAAATGVASLVFRTGRYGSGPRLSDASKTGSGRRDLGAARRAGTDHLGGFLKGAAVRDPHARSLVLEATTRVVFPTMMVLSLFFFFAGHNNPGGGFAGGLVAGLALVLRYLAGGRFELGEALPIDAGRLLGMGLTISAASAIVPLFLGAPALSSATIEFDHVPIFGHIKIVTALGFDLGIYLVVVGLVLDILRSLGARLELDARDIKELRARRLSSHHQYTDLPPTASAQSTATRLKRFSLLGTSKPATETHKNPARAATATTTLSRTTTERDEDALGPDDTGAPDDTTNTTLQEDRP